MNVVLNKLGYRLSFLTVSCLLQKPINVHAPFIFPLTYFLNLFFEVRLVFYVFIEEVVSSFVK